MSTNSTSTSTIPSTPPTYPTVLFKPPLPGSPYPYTASSFTRRDDTDDSDFYSIPRFVTHIDDAAIARLRTYYHYNLPRKGRILDLCSSWVSHFPPELEEAAMRGVRSSLQSQPKSQSPRDKGSVTEAPPSPNEEKDTLKVIGLGLSTPELASNPILAHRITQNLNLSPQITLPSSSSSPSTPKLLDATTCVVSIDYLTQPIPVLRSILEQTREGGTLHLVISNRCFPSKVVGRWLEIGERERLELVAGYVWWSGWRGVEIVDVVEEVAKSEEEGKWGRLSMMFSFKGDPLWVVRGVKDSRAPLQGEGKEKGGCEVL
ncbi:MAG: hypothetical protein L6R41_004003 [Letrouitia leprolyta]|nr:MAG: hypothetical protein L6R41_004003 [Letrouitia leprolyta]